MHLRQMLTEVLFVNGPKRRNCQNATPNRRDFGVDDHLCHTALKMVGFGPATSLHYALGPMTASERCRWSALSASLPQPDGQLTAQRLPVSAFLFWPITAIGDLKCDAAARGRAAWNAGKTVGTKRPLTQMQIWAIRFFLDREGRVRDRALFDLAIDSKLRGCDLVTIKTGDLVTGPEIRTRAMVVQQKT
jgi:hypothetical protein